MVTFNKVLTPRFSFVGDASEHLYNISLGIQLVLGSPGFDTARSTMICSEFGGSDQFVKTGCAAWKTIKYPATTVVHLTTAVLQPGFSS
jgi:hypothetical protein